MRLLFLLTFADLIADSATGFASGLARCLALAATAALHARLQIGLIDCLNVFHTIQLLSIEIISIGRTNFKTALDEGHDGQIKGVGEVDCGVEVIADGVNLMRVRTDGDVSTAQFFIALIDRT